MLLLEIKIVLRRYILTQRQKETMVHFHWGGRGGHDNGNIFNEGESVWLSAIPIHATIFFSCWIG